MTKKRKIEHREVNGKQCHRYEGDSGWTVCEGDCKGVV